MTTRAEKMVDGGLSLFLIDPVKELKWYGGKCPTLPKIHMEPQTESYMEVWKMIIYPFQLGYV